MIQKEPGAIWRLSWWLLFGVAFGATEAALVVYVRRLFGMPPGLDYPAVWAVIRPGETLTSGSFAALFRTHDLLGVEVARESGTLLLLVGAAMAAGRTARERVGIFLYTFAVWDLSYYVWLRIAIDFPRTLTDTDVYFMIPIAWLGPAWMPVCAIMPALVLCGAWLMTRPHAMQPERGVTSLAPKRKKRRTP